MVLGLRIVVDERETVLYERLEVINSKSSSPLVIAKQVLPLGDVVLEFAGEDPRATADYTIIMERKTFADLIASIRDGRYDEQSHRLIHSSGVPRHNIIYLVEGIMHQLNPHDRNLVFATMTSLNYFKGFSVIRTASTQETAEYITQMAIKILRNVEKKKYPWNWLADGTVLVAGPETGGGSPLVRSSSSCTISEHPVLESASAPAPTPPPPYCSVVKKVKKDNITPENIGEIVLCQIPGISSVSAVAIMKKFGTVRGLIDRVTADPHCLDDIYTTSSAGNRRLGSNILTNIRKYLVGESPTGGVDPPEPAPAPLES